MTERNSKGLSRSRMGFRFASRTKQKAAWAFGASVFVTVAVSVTILSESTTLIETFALHPAWFFSWSLFFIFSFILGLQFGRVVFSSYVLEFTDDEIVSRAKWRTRRVPYEAVEIFSPDPEAMFRSEPAVAELRHELELHEFLNVSCRLKPDHFSEREGDFVFFERVQATTPEEQAQIIQRIRSKIAKFDLLFHDWGDDGDETNA